MYMLNPEELRSIHEERVGLKKNFTSRDDKDNRGSNAVKNLMDMMLRDRKSDENK